MIDIVKTPVAMWGTDCESTEQEEEDHSFVHYVCVCVLMRTEGQVLVMEMKTVDGFERYLGGSLSGLGARLEGYRGRGRPQRAC